MYSAEKVVTLWDFIHDAWHERRADYFRATGDRRGRRRDSNWSPSIDVLLKCRNFDFNAAQADGSGLRADIGFENYRPLRLLFLIPVIFHPSRFPTFSSSHFSLSPSLFPFFCSVLSLRYFSSRVSSGEPVKQCIIPSCGADWPLPAPRRLILRRTDFGMSPLTLKNSVRRTFNSVLACGTHATTKELD